MRGDVAESQGHVGSLEVSFQVALQRLVALCRVGAEAAFHLCLQRRAATSTIETTKREQFGRN
jgi:hypothetical protein